MPALMIRWRYLRDRYLSGRLFSSTQAIVEACCIIKDDALDDLQRDEGVQPGLPSDRDEE